MSKASKLIIDTLLNEDAITVVINGHSYYIEPPTIMKIAKAAKYLDALEGERNIKDIIDTMRSLGNACKALSVFITGDESLEEELTKGTLPEITNGLKAAVNLISIKDFIELSTLAKSVARMIAAPRP